MERECILEKEREGGRKIRINEEEREMERESKEDRKEVPTSNIASLPSFSPPPLSFSFSLSPRSPGSLEMRGQAASDPASG